MEKRFKLSRTAKLAAMFDPSMHGVFEKDEALAFYVHYWEALFPMTMRNKSWPLRQLQHLRRYQRQVGPTTLRLLVLFLGSGDGEQAQPSKQLKLLQTIQCSWQQYHILPAAADKSKLKMKWHVTKCMHAKQQMKMLMTWKRNEQLYPIISTLVREYLEIPSSNVPVECIFSTTGLLMNRKRSSLNPLPLNMAMLCQGLLNVLG